MEHLKKFNTQEEYQTWKNSDDYVFPNISKVGDDVLYNDYPDYLWIEALEDLTFSGVISNVISPYYSFDKLNWRSFTSSSHVLRTGQKVYFRNEISLGNGEHFKLNVSGKFNVGGSLLSIFYGSDYLNFLEHDFKTVNPNMTFTAFVNSKVVNAKELVLPLCNEYSAKYFENLFTNCSLLVSSPRIPKLDNTIINSMFTGCTSLQKAPTLKGRYWGANNLFNGCSSLSFIKDLTVGNRYTPDNWVEGVSPTGTFIASSKREDFTRGVNGIPEGWDLYLYDEDNDRYVVKFKVNNIPYEFYTNEPRDITWEEFIASEQNTNGFTTPQIEGATSYPVMFGNDYILMEGDTVVKSDKIILNASYTIGQPTVTTEE